MKFLKRVIFPLGLGVISAFLITLFSEYSFNIFWGTCLLTSTLFLLLINVFFWSGSSKFFGWVVGLAIIFRLGLGLVTTYNLIDWGYDEEPYTSGYLFQDSYVRDNQSWELAKSDEPIWAAFSNDFFSDQYGGLLAISSIVYRVFTPQAHVQMNIIFLVTIINIIGIIFLAEGLKEKDGKTNFSLQSKIIILIFAFYPDAILFSASQMREPLLLGFSGILFWIVHRRNLKIVNRLGLFAIISVLLLLISLKIGLFIIFTFFIWMIFQTYAQDIKILRSKLIAIPIILFTIVALYFSYSWILEAGKWDALLLERSSGFVQYIVSIIGARYRLLFASLYGLFQPVLPAALIEPSKLFWKTLNSLRATGWYLLIPAILYGLVYIFRQKDKNRKLEFVFIWSLSLFWIVLSSIRAGGDMWDNPRYRLSFLLFISFAVGQSFTYGWNSKDHWLKRIILGEVIFVLFFLQWYISRYTNVFNNLPFFQMVIILTIIFLIIIFTGVLKEINLNKKQSNR